MSKLRTNKYYYHVEFDMIVKIVRIISSSVFVDGHETEIGIAETPDGSESCMVAGLALEDLNQEIVKELYG